MKPFKAQKVEQHEYVCQMPRCQTSAGCQCQQPFKYGTLPAWVCPKCDRVYGPQVMSCGPCNERAEINRIREGFSRRVTRR